MNFTNSSIDLFISGFNGPHQGCLLLAQVLQENHQAKLTMAT